MSNLQADACPFCGSEGDINSQGHVECSSCGAAAPDLKTWNGRIAQQDFRVAPCTHPRAYISAPATTTSQKGHRCPDCGAAWNTFDAPDATIPQGYWLAPMEPDEPMRRSLDTGPGRWVYTNVETYQRMRDSWLSRHPAAPTPTASIAPQHCQCPACIGGTMHASDCAVHGRDSGAGIIRGSCDCGAESIAPKAEALPLAPAYAPCAEEPDGRCCGTGECWTCPLAASVTQAPKAEAVTCERCGHENWVMEGKAPCQITEADKRTAPVAQAAAGAPNEHDELARDADGDIAIDWQNKAGDMLSMSLSKDGRLCWAVHRAGPNGSGTVQLNEHAFWLLNDVLTEADADRASGGGV